MSSESAKALEKIQRRYSKRLPGTAKLNYNDRLRSLRVLSSTAARKYNDLIFAFKMVTRVNSTEAS